MNLSEWSAWLNRERPQPAEISGLAFTPAKIAGPAFDPYRDPLGNDVTSMIAEALSKVQAEDARLRRMLPPAPRGMYWHAELQSRERLDFASYRGDVVMRLVYRLYDERTHRPVEAPPIGPYPKDADR